MNKRYLLADDWDSKLLKVDINTWPDVYKFYRLLPGDMILLGYLIHLWHVTGNKSRCEVNAEQVYQQCPIAGVMHTAAALDRLKDAGFLVLC